jgi:cephalosporin hydroxylase
MKPPSGEVITIDTNANTVTVKSQDQEQTWAMESPEAFEAASRGWLRVGWDVKHLYSFTWLGRPLLQLPEDMIRVQELIWKIRPDVILETGVAHGGSLLFNATICQVMEHGRVIGVERGLFPENRDALKNHVLSDYITVVEGDSVDPKTVNEVKGLIKSGEKVLLILDSNHSYDHVLSELRAYSSLVAKDSFIIVCDGIIIDLVGAPRSQSDWAENNPLVAARDFTKENPGFKVVNPEFLFNESLVGKPPTYWKGGYLQRADA